MKKLLTLFCILTVCMLASISRGEDSDLESEFQAARLLKKMCWVVDFYGDDGDGVWKHGKLITYGDNWEEIEIPIIDVSLECDCLSKEMIEQIMKLKRLRELRLHFRTVEDTDFPVHELKHLEILDISPGFSLDDYGGFIPDKDEDDDDEEEDDKEEEDEEESSDEEDESLDEEDFSLEENDFASEEDDDSLVEYCPIPNCWGKSLGMSRSIITLDIPSQRPILQEVAKMKQLRTLRLWSSPTGETDLLPVLLPLKDSLRDLTIRNEESPQEAAEVLKQFTSLQALDLHCFDYETNLDGFLNDIKHLQLRFLGFGSCEIGTEGEKILREWESLQEVILPWDFPAGRFQALEKIKIPVMLVYYYKDPKTNSIRTDGERKVQMCQKFFKNDIGGGEHSRPYRIDKDGNYVHWNEIHGGIWMSSH